MTQCERVVQYANRFGSITTWDAFKDLGITRLSARIHDLKKKGYVIEKKREVSKNRLGETVYYDRYYITKE